MLLVDIKACLFYVLGNRNSSDDFNCKVLSIAIFDLDTDIVSLLSNSTGMNVKMLMHE